MTNRELRRALLEKLKVTPQALSQRVQRLKRRHPMTTEEATYLVAHQAGIMLDRFLGPTVVARVRDIDFQMTAGQPVESIVRPPRKSVRSDKALFNKGGPLDRSDPILPGKSLREAKQMAELFPYLYLLENSIREFICRVMAMRFGHGWWSGHTPKRLRETVADRMTAEKRNSWHQRRGQHQIYYLDLNQLPDLVRNNQACFIPDFLPDMGWFENLVKEIYPSRCVLCHMNPLSGDNIQAVKLRYKQWQRQVESNMAQLAQQTGTGDVRGR